MKGRRRKGQQEEEEEEEVVLESLLSWMSKHGFALDGGLEVKTVGGVRGLYTTKLLPLGAEVLSIPQSVMLRTDSQLGSPKTPFGLHLSSSASAFDLMGKFRAQANDEITTLALALFYERYIVAENSFWRPWIASLPKKLTNTIFYSPADLYDLRGTSVYESTENALGFLKAQYNKFRAAFVPGILPEDEFSLKRFCWAKAVAWSRAFRLHIEEEEAKEGDEGRKKGKGKEQKEKLVLGFMPFADMMNYTLEEPCDGEWIQEGLEYKVTTRRELQAGEEVMFEYGCKGNAELMLHYGFAIPNNPYTCIDLALHIPLSSSSSSLDPLLVKRKIEICNRTLGLSYTKTKGIRMTVEVPIVKGTAYFQDLDEPSSLMPVLRIIAATSNQELDALIWPNGTPPSSVPETKKEKEKKRETEKRQKKEKKKREWVKSPKDSKETQLRKPFGAGLEVELRALEALATHLSQLLDSHSTTLQEDQEILDRGGTEFKAWCCVVMRQEEKKICRELLLNTERTLKEYDGWYL